MNQGRLTPHSSSGLLTAMTNSWMRSRRLPILLTAKQANRWTMRSALPTRPFPSHQQSARHYDKKTRISPSRNSLRFENGKIRNDFARCDGGISRCSPCFLADNKSAILCISARMRNLRRSGMAAGYAMRGAGKISFGCPCRHSGGRRCEMSDKRTYSEEGPQCPHCGRQFTADDGAYYQNEY